MIKLKHILESENWNMDQNSYFYKGVNPTVDLVIIHGDKILLIKRKSDANAEANKWALPGGFQDTYAKKGEEWREDKETALDAAIREVKEETGLDVKYFKDKIKKIGVYEGESRDVRDNEISWSRTTAFYLDLPLDYDINLITSGDDAQDAQFIKINAVNSATLAFDHEQIISRGLELYKND